MKDSGTDKRSEVNILQLFVFSGAMYQKTVKSV